MSDITETAGAARASSGLSRAGAMISAPFKAVFRGLVAIAESNDRIRKVARLSAMSDAQLAVSGLRREDIVRSVFVDRA